MRDPRYDWNNLDVVHHRTRERQEEQALLDALPDLSSLREVLRQWWCDFVEYAPQLSGDADLTKAAARLAREGWGKMGDSLVPLLEALSHSMTDPTADDIMTRAARRLLAEEIGHATAVGPQSVEVVLRASEFANVHAHNLIVFYNAFIAACVQDMDRRDHWCQVLSDLPSDLGAYLNVTDGEPDLLGMIRVEEATIQESGNPTVYGASRRPSSESGIASLCASVFSLRWTAQFC